MMGFAELWAAWLQIKGYSDEIAAFKGKLSEAEERNVALERLYKEAQAALEAESLPSPPPETVMMSGAILYDAFQARWNIAPTLLDAEYPVPARADLDRFLAAQKVSRERYTADGHDCDDFAWHLANDARHWGINCGFVVGYMGMTPHAWNVFVERAGSTVELTQVEPQTGNVVLSGYVPRSALI